MPKAVLRNHETNGHYTPSQDEEPSVGLAETRRQRAGLVSPLCELARDPQLIRRILSDIASLGVVGEEDNCLMMYLTGTSRLLKHPLRLIVRGPSGSGKSFPVMRVVSMFPVDAVIEATSLTPQALYYGAPGWLEHKFLVMGERSHRTDEDGADRTAATRQLISENRIVKQVTMNVDGQLQTVTLIQNGPIAFVETTTAKTLFDEDENRCIQLWTDESKAQTQKIMKAAAQHYMGGKPVDEQAIIERHREFQSALQSVDVVIPFAQKLAEQMPAEKVKARRAIKLVLATVETIAFLHQFQRERDTDGRLIATDDDYQVARRLLMAPLQEIVGIGDRAWKAYAALKGKFSRQVFDSTQTIQAGIFNNKMTRDRALKDLVELEVLRCVEAGKGKKPARWAWTNNKPKQVLPESV